MKKIYILFLLFFIGILQGSKNVWGKEGVILDSVVESKTGDISYGVPLEEIGDKLEYIYTYMNSIGDYVHNTKQLSELGVIEYFPEGENITMLIYLAEGNRVVFIPKEETNTTVTIEGQPVLVKYSPEHAGYVFYCLTDWEVEDRGVPVNFFEYGYGSNFGACIARAGKWRDWHKTSNTFEIEQYYVYSFALEKLVYLGEVEVSFNANERVALPHISIEENPYIELMKGKVSEILGEEERYGSYQFYLDTFGLYLRPDRKVPDCIIGGAIEGKGMREVVYFEINEDRASPIIYPKDFDSDLVFQDFNSDEEREKRFTEIVNRHRGVFSFEVTERSEEKTDDQYEEMGQRNERTFPDLTLKESADCIEYVLSYSDWFGMKELGYRDAKVLTLQGKEVSVYQHRESREILFAEKGSDDFYSISINPYIKGEGSLPTTLCSKVYSTTEYMEMLDYLGNTVLDIPFFSSYNVPKVHRDKFVRIVEEQIETLLTKENMIGTYSLYIGEYETMYSERVCISAAVIGERKSYYFRYYVVPVGDSYYCWPVGFGLDGSLSECEAEAYHMNRICIDRTIELKRYTSKIIIN